MSQYIAAVGNAKNLTATGPVTTGACQLLGFSVNSTNVGTLVLSDGGAAISGTITPAIGYHRFPADCGGALSATIGGTALDVTFFVATGN